MKLSFLKTLIPPLSSIFLTGLCLSGGRALACTFSGLSNGAFATPALQQGWLESASAIGGAGTSATVIINCTTASQISAATIQHISSPTSFNTANPSARTIVRYPADSKVLNIGTSGFSSGSGNWGLSNSADFNLPSNTNATLDVSLVVGFADSRVLPAGNYSYTVTLTATSP
ncbi:hypothetical protein [Spirulina major]|uniref:hypothetical protein n=1 Tax=Spirulina major TaxID=270636 RepID=UPI000933757A|nr:hypothetical protein [Spirulina major]